LLSVKPVQTCILVWDYFKAPVKVNQSTAVHLTWEEFLKGTTAKLGCLILESEI